MTPAVVRLGVSAPGTAELLAALHRQCFDEAWSCASIADLLAMPGVSCFVAAVADEPCGFALCRVAADETEVLSLGVIPEARRRGIARRLLSASLDGAAGRGVRKVYLEVASDNVAARRLYRGHGFGTVGVRADYYRDESSPPRDALVLALDVHTSAHDH